MEQGRFRSEEQKVNFAALEERILKLWERGRIFEKSVKKREGAERFTFVEGPPTANGLPHPGHILTRVIKDVVLRYQTMRGFYVQRKAGWDTHGLPVEIEVEKELGISTKRQIEEYGIEKFNKKCKQSVFRYEKEWEEATRRVGFWIDLKNPYITFDNEYIESVWWLLKEIWKKGLLYNGHKVVPFCPRCETALSSHEVAQGYEDVEDPSIYVKFRLKQKEDEDDADEPVYLLAWTTTPWTLLANVALAVHPDHTYVCVNVKESAKEKEGEKVEKLKLILAEARLDVLNGGEYEIIERIKGVNLEGRQYEPLFEYEHGVSAGTGEKGVLYEVITAPFVTLEEGTGIVHIAPAFGEEDYEIGKEKNLVFFQPVSSNGRFTPEIPPLEGIFVKDADAKIIEMLREHSQLYKSGSYRHKYPFCWRCGSPLVYYARQSWFINMSALKDDLLANNEKIRWYPHHLKYGRFGNFLENIEDWALSRERFWGTPLNIWRCTTAGCEKEYCVGSVEELKQKALAWERHEFDFDLHRPYIDEVVLSCDECGGEMRRVEDVIDCWYDSGAAPFAQWHYPFAKKEFEPNFPASFITEAIDQTRGWFYSLLAVSTAVFNEAPYRSVLSLGHILDEKGVKMSKSKGNVVDLNLIFNKEGADALRWYFLTAGPPDEDIKFSEKAIAEKQRKFLGTLWNSYFFFVTYANIDEFSPGEKEISVKKRSMMDRWVMSRLNSVIKEVIGHNEKYELHQTTRKIEGFVVEDLSNWYIRRSRRRFWMAESTFDKDCAYVTLYEVLVALCRLLAPFVPFLTEHIYQNLVASWSLEGENESGCVHFCDYPEVEEGVIDVELEESMHLLSKLVEVGRRLRADAGIKTRQPLNEVVIVGSNGKGKREEIGSLGLEAVNGGGEILKEELNVKEIKIKFEKEGEGEFVVEGYKKAEVEEGISMFLDVTLDKGLLQEGLVRDIVRRIQGMRKDLDLEYTTKIRIMYGGDEEIKEAMRALSDYICEETLAVSMEEGIPISKLEKSEEVFLEKKWKIDKKEVYLAIEIDRADINII